MKHFNFLTLYSKHFSATLVLVNQGTVIPGLELNCGKIMKAPVVAFIGAGSTVFMKNIVGDILLRSQLAGSQIKLMDIDLKRLSEAKLVADNIVSSLDVPARISAHSTQREAIDGADFVITAFQIAGYKPGTIHDFEIPRKYGLRQTIADTLGVGGIMRGLRTVPKLWQLCDDMRELCPEAVLLQYVNPMAINCWAIAEKYPDIRCIGLCHSVQETVACLANDLEIQAENIRFECAGINHVAFFLTLEEILADGSKRDLYPRLKKDYKNGRIPKENQQFPNCPNLVRYDVMRRLGYFVTESSEHFAEYVPWYIKQSRPDIAHRFEIPLDEYLRRCEDQIQEWKQFSEDIREAGRVTVEPTHEYASDVINSVITGQSSVIHGNVRNGGLIGSLPVNCCVEVPCLVDGTGVHPIRVGNLPPQLSALMRTNINVQELTVAALMEEKRDHIYHAAMMDPHTSADLDIDQIHDMVDELIFAHAEWLPEWLQDR